MALLLFIVGAVIVLGIVWLLCRLFGFPQEVSLIILLVAALIIIIALTTQAGALHIGR